MTLGTIFLWREHHARAFCRSRSSAIYIVKSEGIIMCGVTSGRTESALNASHGCVVRSESVSCSIHRRAMAGGNYLVMFLC